MDTSISFDMKTITELLESPFLEEKELGLKVAETIAKIVALLRPILKYIVSPIELSGACGDEILTVRAIYVRDLESGIVGDKRLFLDEHGEFFLSRITREGYSWVCDEGAWETFPIAKVLAGLQGALRNAIEKREKYLANIRARSTELDRIVAALPTE